MSETTPLIKAALNLRVGVGFDVYQYRYFFIDIFLAFTEPVWFNMISMLKKYQKAVM